MTFNAPCIVSVSDFQIIVIGYTQPYPWSLKQSHIQCLEAEIIDLRRITSFLNEITELNFMQEIANFFCCCCTQRGIGHVALWDIP